MPLVGDWYNGGPCELDNKTSYSTKKKNANLWIHLVYFTDFSYLFLKCNLNVLQNQGMQTVKKEHGKKMYSDTVSVFLFNL